MDIEKLTARDQSLVHLGHAQACLELLQSIAADPNRMDHFIEMTVFQAKEEMAARGIEIRGLAYFEQAVRVGVNCTVQRIVKDVKAMTMEKKEELDAG